MSSPFILDVYGSAVFFGSGATKLACFATKKYIAQPNSTSTSKVDISTRACGVQE